MIDIILLIYCLSIPCLDAQYVVMVMWSLSGLLVAQYWTDGNPPDTDHITSTTHCTSRLGMDRQWSNNTGCPRMSTHILKIFKDKINRTRKVRFSLHDSRTIKVSRTIFVLWSTHDCVDERSYAALSATAVFQWAGALRMALDHQKVVCVDSRIKICYLCAKEIQSYAWSTSFS